MAPAAFAQTRQQVDRLASGQVRPEVDVAGNVRDAAVQVDGIAPRIAIEQADGPAVGAQQPEQDADGDGLAGAVRAEEPVDLTGAHLEVEPVEGSGGTERLDELFDPDR